MSTIRGALPTVSARRPGMVFLLVDRTMGPGPFPFIGPSELIPLPSSDGMVRFHPRDNDGYERESKIDVADRIANEFFRALTTEVRGSHRHRLDVSALGYGIGETGVVPLWRGPLARSSVVTVGELADKPDRLGPLREAGDVRDETGRFPPKPFWVKGPSTASWSRPVGPMKIGFGAMRSTLAGWKRRPRGEHLVLGLHVTDGKSGDPVGAVRSLSRQVASQGGKLLMTNVYLTEQPLASVVFPTPADAVRFDERGKRLFESSSVVPPSLAARLGTKPGARMMAVNPIRAQRQRLYEVGRMIASE